MVMGVLAIVKIEFRYAHLQKAPERFAQVRAKPHQVQVCHIRRSLFTKIKTQQQFALLIIECLIDGKVAEVKENITHTGIFPIENPDGVAIINEIAGEQVVMAWLRLIKWPQCLLDL